MSTIHGRQLVQSKLLVSFKQTRRFTPRKYPLLGSVPLWRSIRARYFKWRRAQYQADPRNWEELPSRKMYFLSDGRILVHPELYRKILAQIELREYTCTDCGHVNFKPDNRKIRVGFCDQCEHPLWNPVDEAP